MEIDCGFENRQGWFRYRACAIIMEEGDVLMAGTDSGPYYYSVGGGVHLHESAEDAVRREVLEETGIAYEIDRLAYVHENFFVGKPGQNEVKCHEIALYFLMKPKGRKEEIKVQGLTSGNKREHMHWLSLEKLADYYLFPTFFKEKLLNMKSEVEHIVTYE